LTYFKRVVFVKMDHPAATQAEAEQVCADNLGHLAFFKNEAEFNEYFKETSENDEWLGTIYKIFIIKT
jgi:hypothetical protein